MIKDLIKIANGLDALGLRVEADTIDGLIKRLAQQDPVQSVNSYIDPEGLPEEDRKEFFLYLSYKIDRADELANPEPTYSFGGFSRPITRETLSSGFLTDRDFNKLYEKYGEAIIDALWKYIDNTADILERRRSSNPSERDRANDEFDDLKWKITKLRS